MDDTRGGDFSRENPIPGAKRGDAEQLTQRIAEALRGRLVEHGYAMSLDTASDLAGAVVAALQLAPEERWVPVARDGTRWEPCTYTQAIEALASPCPEDVGDSWKLTYVIHERSHRTPWVEVQP